MAKYNLDSGFLILYDWMPAIESLPARDLKKLMFALIRFQRDGVPLPDFGNTQVGIYARMIEPVIKRRREGQEHATQKAPTPAPTPGAPPGPAPHREEKKREAEISEAQLLPPKGEGEAEAAVTESDFAEFWKAYPKHTFKKDAHTAYFEEVHSAEDHEELMALLNEWKESEEWRKEKGKWVKRSDKFLTEIFPTRDSPPAPEQEGSFDTDEFFEAALRRSYRLINDDE